MCSQFGGYSKFIPGVDISIGAEYPDVSLDLNHLYRDAIWSKELKRFIKRGE